MADDDRFDVELPGCTPEPLMAYLKALGILRLVCEQKDSGARGWWQNDVFQLRSTLDPDALARFLLEEYQPTPIVVPWTGSDFFNVRSGGNRGPYSKTPTATAVIEAFLASTTDRLAHYREAIRATIAAMSELEITKKEDIDTQKGKEAKHRKTQFFSNLRQSLTDDVVAWIDAAGVCGNELRFSTLLGSGGGSDGNTHFSDNFMQNLWDVLPDFDVQRKPKKHQQAPSTTDASEHFLRSALFANIAVPLIHKRTSSLFDSGAVGGPNATQGMERDSLANPWNVILALEGAIAFSGAAAKRLGANVSSEAVFPFQVSAIATDEDRLADKERAGSEVWLPLWDRPALAGEILRLLNEGRAQCGDRQVRSGIDMARAAATLGVDRGINAFSRHVIVKGRVGGDNYNTAACLGRIAVRERRDTDLLRQIDPWLDSFRRSAGDKNAPPRFLSALRRIDSAIFDFCKFGGGPFFQGILTALGQAEHELARTPGKIGQSKYPPSPIAGLSRDWILAADDGSAEFVVSRSLAFIRRWNNQVGPLRANLEPVDWEKKQCRSWAEKDRSVVWNTADLPTNVANVLQRRTMDAARSGCDHLSLDSHFTSPLESITAFLAGDLDDERIQQLIWGLMLVDPHGSGGRTPRHHNTLDTPASPLRREYALLKLLFLPRPLATQREDGSWRWRLAKPEESGLTIRPEPRIIPLVRSGRIGEACRIAAQRLRVSGLPPMPGPLPTGVMRDDQWRERTIDHRNAQRLAAALLIPISSASVNHLVHLVCRDPSRNTAAKSLALAAEGAIE